MDKLVVFTLLVLTVGAERNLDLCSAELSSLLWDECIDATPDNCPKICKEALAQQVCKGISAECYQEMVALGVDSLGGNKEDIDASAKTCGFDLASGQGIGPGGGDGCGKDGDAIGLRTTTECTAALEMALTVDCFDADTKHCPDECAAALSEQVKLGINANCYDAVAEFIEMQSMDLEEVEAMSVNCGAPLGLLNGTAASPGRSIGECADALEMLMVGDCMDATPDDCPAACAEGLGNEAALGISKDCYDAVVSYYTRLGGTLEDLEGTAKKCGVELPFTD